MKILTLKNTLTKNAIAYAISFCLVFFSFILKYHGTVGEREEQLWFFPPLVPTLKQWNISRPITAETSPLHASSWNQARYLSPGNAEVNHIKSWQFWRIIINKMLICVRDLYTVPEVLKQDPKINSIPLDRVSNSSIMHYLKVNNFLGNQWKADFIVLLHLRLKRSNNFEECTALSPSLKSSFIFQKITRVLFTIPRFTNFTMFHVSMIFNFTFSCLIRKQSV